MSRKRPKREVYAFTTSLPPADFKQSLRETVYDSGHLLYEDTPSGLNLGIERGGHSGGYWYVATLTETEDGTELRGEIVYRSLHGDGSYREATKREKIQEKFFIAIVVLLCLIPILVFYAVWGILLLIGKLRGKPVEATMSTEEKLTRFMTEVMGCHIIE